MNAYQIAEQSQKQARRILNALRSLQTEHVSKLVYPETLNIIGFAVDLNPKNASTVQLLSFSIEAEIIEDSDGV